MSSLRSDGRNAWWERFTAVEETGNLRIRLEIDCANPANPRCRSYSFKVVDGSVPVAKIGESLERLVSRAVGEAATWLRMYGETVPGTLRFDPVPAQDQWEMRSAYASAADPRRNAPPPPWKVAKVCLKARRAGQNEAAAVMERLHAEKSTAYRWIKLARAQRFLD